MQQDVIQLLTDLVTIDSVNPSLVPGAAGEARAVEHLERWVTTAPGRRRDPEDRARPGCPGRPRRAASSARASAARSRHLHGSLIHGGLEESTIPDRCVLTLERRTLPGETAADVEGDIADLLDRCRRVDPDLRATQRTTLVRDPFEVRDDAPIVGIVADAAGTVLGRRPDLAGVSYWADAAFIAAAGIPTVLFGPAGDGAYAQVEWASLDSTVACAETLTVVAERFCR